MRESRRCSHNTQQIWREKNHLRCALMQLSEKHRFLKKRISMTIGNPGVPNIFNQFQFNPKKKSIKRNIFLSEELIENTPHSRITICNCRFSAIRLKLLLRGVFAIPHREDSFPQRHLFRMGIWDFSPLPENRFGNRLSKNQQIHNYNGNS